MQQDRVTIMLAEANDLDAIEANLRARFNVYAQNLENLRHYRSQSGVEDSNGLSTSNLSHALRLQMDRDIRSQQEELSALDECLNRVPKCDTWNQFKHLLHQMKVEEEAYFAADREAKERIVAAEWWSRATHPDSWCDLRLPPADIQYRTAVHRLNKARSTAFNYYHHNQQELRLHHRERYDALRKMISPDEASSLLLRDMTLTEDQPSLPASTPPAVSVGPLSGDIRGPFEPVKYFNYLDTSGPAIPVFGLALEATGAWLTNLILNQNVVPNSPPPPVFTAPIPDNHDITGSILAAFRMERMWEGETHLHHAFENVTRSTCKRSVNRGWLLGFLLVNLPQPLIYLTEPKRRVPSSKMSRVMPTGLALELFKKLWDHTDPDNIQLAASAISHLKGTESAINDIRGAYNIEIGRPHPSHLARRSSSYFWIPPLL